MPTAAQTFQGIAGPADGPFNDYLRPVQPRAIDLLPSSATTASGYETGPVGVGKVALGFLEGIRQNRLAQFAEEDKNVQTSLDNFRQHVNSQLANPDLTEEGRADIRAKADDIMNRHMHYEMRDVPKHGVGGFFKSVLEHATGGPIKTREPINWDEATGQITNAVKPEHSQKYNYQQLVQEAQAKVEALRRNVEAANPGTQPSVQQLQQTLLPISQRMRIVAPNYADGFREDMGVGALSEGTLPWLISGAMAPAAPKNAAAALPVTAPPPAPPPQASSAGLYPSYSAVGAPGPADATAGLTPDMSRPESRGVTPVVRPADSGAARRPEDMIGKVITIPGGQKVTVTGVNAQGQLVY